MTNFSKGNIIQGELNAPSMRSQVHVVKMMSSQSENLLLKAILTSESQILIAKVE